MKRNKGFTLIELLAVIVILAVIALIATPIIMNVINEAKTGAAKDAVYGYVKAVELATMGQVSEKNSGVNGVYNVDENGNLKQGDVGISVAFKGNKPTGSVLISDGQVLVSNLVIDGNLYGLDGNGEVALVKPATYTLGQEIYFNPYTGRPCSSTEVWTSSNTSSQCFKWNVITADDSEQQTSIEMLLDHNLMRDAWWTLADTNVGGPTELVRILNETTGQWKNTIQPANIIMKANDEQSYRIDYNGAKARIITAQEIATFTDTSWNQNLQNIPVNHLEQFKWLFSNLDSNHAYWTSTAHGMEQNRAWYVYYEERPVYLLSITGRGGIANVSFSGLRPVIRVLKSTIQ